MPRTRKIATHKSGNKDRPNWETVELDPSEQKERKKEKKLNEWVWERPFHRGRSSPLLWWKWKEASLRWSKEASTHRFPLSFLVQTTNKYEPPLMPYIPTTSILLSVFFSLSLQNFNLGLTTIDAFFPYQPNLTSSHFVFFFSFSFNRALASRNVVSLSPKTPFSSWKNYNLQVFGKLVGLHLNIIKRL